MMQPAAGPAGSQPAVPGSFSPAAAQSPQQIGVFGLARVHRAPVRRDDLCGEQVVAGEPMLGR